MIRSEVDAAQTELGEVHRELESAAARMRSALSRLALGVHRKDVAALFGNFRLGTRSRLRLTGIHPDLMAVVEYAIRVSPIDFGITRTGGVRDAELQRKLMGKGASKTLRSRHLTGHAVDIAPMPDGVYSPASKHAARVHLAFVEASEALDVPLRWGGDWDGDGIERERGENDLVHHELPRKDYGNNRYSQSEKAADFLRSIEVSA